MEEAMVHVQTVTGSTYVHTYILNDRRFWHKYYYKFNIYFVLFLGELDFIYFFTCFLTVCDLITININWYNSFENSFDVMLLHFLIAYFLSFFDFITLLVRIYLLILSDILLFTWLFILLLVYYFFGHLFYYFIVCFFFRSLLDWPSRKISPKWWKKILGTKDE